MERWVRSMSKETNESVFLNTGHPGDLVSFPTRRSSDLAAAVPPLSGVGAAHVVVTGAGRRRARGDRKSTRLNSSHEWISYAGFCLKKQNPWQSLFSLGQNRMTVALGDVTKHHVPIFFEH